MSVRVRPAIAVLVSRFPLITETFILREIIELERQGQPIVLVPMIQEHPKVVHDEARSWVARAIYTRWVSPQILLANLRLFTRAPLRALSLLAWIIRSTLTHPRTLVKSLMLFPKSVYLAERLRAEGVGHLHAHFATHPTTMARLISQLSGIPFSFTMHAHDIFVERALLREKIRDAVFIRSISSFNRRFIESLYQAEAGAKISVVHVGIDPEKYEGRHEREAGEDPRVICIAALKPYKGIPFLIDACALLKNEGISFRCDVIGTGPLQASVRRAIVKKGLHGVVTLRGALPQHAVAEEIRNADLFVLPSIIAADGQMEGIPVALMEAMAAGKPVVATAISGIPELVVHEQTGLLVDPASPRMLADAIKRLLSDGALCQQLVRNGRAKVREEFELGRTVSELLAIFDHHGQAASARVTEILQAVVNGDDESTVFGLRRMHESRDAVVLELSTQSNNGIPKELVVKRHLSRDGESRPPAQRAADEFRVLQFLQQHFEGRTDLGVPRPLRFDRDTATLMTGRAAGTPLTSLLRELRVGSSDVHEARRSLSRVGEWLHAFQAVESEAPADALDPLAEGALRDAHQSNAPAAIRRRIGVLRDTVRERGSASVAHHGDFWPGNVYVAPSRVEVIDFEGFAQSLRAHDVAYFFLHVSLYFAIRGEDRMPLVRESFFGGYRQPLSADELELCRLATVLQMAARDDRQLPWVQRIARRRVLRRELER